LTVQEEEERRQKAVDAEMAGWRSPAQQPDTVHQVPGPAETIPPTISSAF